MSLRILCLVAAMVLALPGHAGVYKWTDAQGRVHYGDAPPAAAKPTRLKLQTHAGPAEVAPVSGTESGVTIFTTEWCGVCQRAKAFMKQNGVPFREWDVERTEYGAIKFGQLGGTAVPLITVGSQRMTGFDAERFMKLWQGARTAP